MSGITRSVSARRWRGSTSAVALTAALSAAGVLGFGASALAQDAGAAPAQTGPIENIEVTAQFRRENVQNVPIAITAVNAAMLDARSQTNVQDITAQAPNVTLKPNGQAFGSSLLRLFVALAKRTLTIASSLVSAFMSMTSTTPRSPETCLICSTWTASRFCAVRRARWPARTRLVAAIKLFTQKPNGEGGGFVEGTYGSFDRVDFRGSADFAIVPDKLFVRFAGSIAQPRWICDAPRLFVHAQRSAGLDFASAQRWSGLQDRNRRRSVIHRWSRRVQMACDGQDRGQCDMGHDR